MANMQIPMIETIVGEEQPMKHSRIRSVYVVDRERDIENMFVKRNFAVKQNVVSTSDLVVFGGGNDINPALYGETKLCSTDQPNCAKDTANMNIISLCIQHQIPMVGICRGAQLLHVLCGGQLWQNINHHAEGRHNAVDLDTQEVFSVSSTHHQQMRFGTAMSPQEPPKEAAVLMVANESTVREASMKDNGLYAECRIRTSNALKDQDLEAVMWPKKRVLCFQPHPEYKETDRCTDKFFEYVDRLFAVSKAIGGR